MLSRLSGPVRRAVDSAVERGQLDAALANGVTQLVFGAVQEASLGAGRKTASRAELDRALGWLLERLLSPERR